MPFMNSQGPIPGIDFSIPDIYLQATPVGLIPIPLFSFGFRISVIATCFRFLLSCMPGHNVFNKTPVTVSGPGNGVASGMVCGASGNVKGSAKLIVQCGLATRSVMDPTIQNGMTPNSVGISSPSQIRLINPVG